MTETWNITNREEWLQRRLADITASDIGGLAGVDAYRTPLKIWAEKTGQVLGAEDNASTRRGRWFESGVEEALREAYPDWSFENPRVYLRDPEVRLGATPDRFAIRPDRSGRGNVQLKIVSKPVFERDWIDGEPPLKFQLQSITEAMLGDCSWNMVAAAVVDTYGADLHVREVPRHPAAEARIRELAREFWAIVDAGGQPAANYKVDGPLIEAMHPEGGQKPPLDLSTHNRIAFLCEERLAWQTRRRNAEGALEEVDAEIKHVLGDYDAAEHPDFKITWKLQKRKEFIVPAAEYRTLRVTRRGDS